jgi:hypothetical protein
MLGWADRAAPHRGMPGFAWQPTGLLFLSFNNKAAWRSGWENVMSWWPGWNSIEGAAKWADVFFWAGFALLVLLAGCELLSKAYAWRKDTLIAMRDDLLANADTGRARQAEQERPKVQDRYDAETAGARAPATEAERTEPPPEPPQPQMQPQIPQAAEPMARTPEQVARLQERSPRGLTESQKKTIVGILAPFRGQRFSVVCIAGDPEGKHIGEEIVTVLRAAGWDFSEAGVAEATYQKEPLGLSLMVNAGQIMTPSVLRPVAMLVKAFADAGLMQRNGALADPNIPRDRIEVRIGRNRNPS